MSETANTSGENGAGVLKPNAMGLPSAFAMSVAFVSPTIGIVFIAALLASVAGASSPLAFALSTVAMACTAYALASFAGRVPSAGLLYSSSAQAFGSATGLVVGVVLMVAYLVVSPLNTDMFGGFISPIIKGWTGLDISWWVLLIFINLFAAVLAWYSIHRSMQFDLALIVGEVLIVGTVLIVAVIHGGISGQIPKAFTPSLSPGNWHGVSEAFVFTVFAFFGWEGSSTLAEEVHLPRKTIPYALVGSVLLSGVYLTFGVYAVTVGFGGTHIGALVGSSNPISTLTVKLLSSWYVNLVDLAAISALTGVIIAIHNANFRLIYSLGRDGMLPRALARTHHKHQTPYVAIVVFTIFGIISGLIFGDVWGPVPAFGILGYFTGLFIAVVYFMTDAAIIVFMWRKHRREHSWFRHVAVPGVGGVVILYALYKSVIPLPTGVERPMPFILLGIIVASIVLVLIMKRTNPSSLEKVGKSVFVEAAVARPEALLAEVEGRDLITDEE
jgi:amino acid transporter